MVWYGDLVQRLVEIFSEWGVLGAFGAMVLEGLSVPFPSALVVGLLASITPGADRLWLLVVCGTVGYTLGALGPYFVGRTGGRKLVLKYGQRVWLNPARLELAEKWFARYGPKVVALCRPFFFGTYVSYLAGMARMPLPLFLGYTAGAIWVWTVFLVFSVRYLAIKGNLLWRIVEGEVLVGWTLLVAIVLAGGTYGWSLARRNRKG